MTLTLTIENETSLPDGGPLSVTIQGKRGIDIGRDSHLDWTLPDPTRFISGRHCEVRFKDGGYWLHDVSTNGTFLNGAEHRMPAPHRLCNGDRFAVGTYIVAVALDDGAGSSAPGNDAPPAAPARARDDAELWASEGEIAPPIDARGLRPPPSRASPRSDFLDWAADVPAPAPAMWPEISARRPPAVTRDGDMIGDPPREMDWAAGRPSSGPAAPAAPPPTPAPRRPASAEAPKGFWDESASSGDARPPRATPLARARTAEIAEPAASPPPAPPERTVASPDAFLRQLATAAGLPDDLFARADPAALARELGGALRIVTENLMQLLQARAQSKQLARSASHTMIQAVGNNPLKFAPSAADALRIMFGPPTQSYLDASRALAESFADLKQHQITTYAAMQHALAMLMADLGPRAIEESAADDRGIGGLLTPRKAKLWDAYVARWQAKVRADERGPIEAFMLHFAEYYDRAADATPRSSRQPQSQSRATHTDNDDVLE